MPRSLRFAARSGFAELVGVKGYLLQEHHVMAEPVECFRVDAAAVPAERPRCLDLLAAAVLAWFGLDDHCLKPSTFGYDGALVSVPSVILVEGFVLFGIAGHCSNNGGSMNSTLRGGFGRPSPSRMIARTSSNGRPN